MPSKQDLQDELDAAVERLNRGRDAGIYDYELGSHASGLAVDMDKDGEGFDKVLAQFHRAVARAGYIISATMVTDTHTRLFLRDQDEFLSDAQRENPIKEFIHEYVEHHPSITEARHLDDLDTLDGAEFEIRVETDGRKPGNSHIGPSSPAPRTDAGTWLKDQGYSISIRYFEECGGDGLKSKADPNVILGVRLEAL